MATSSSAVADVEVLNVVQEVRVPCASLDVVEKQFLVLDVQDCFVIVLYLPKRAAADLTKETTVTLHSKTFWRSHLQEALNWLKEEAHIVDDEKRKLFVLGEATQEEVQQVSATLTKVSVHHDTNRLNFTASTRGFSFLLQNLKKEELCHTEKFVDKMCDLTEMTEKWKAVEEIREAYKGSFADFQTNSKLPCLYAHYAHYGHVFLMKADGSSELVYFEPLAGLYFRGLNYALLGTDSYEELCRLASTGFRGHVDTQIKDVFTDDNPNPYGTFPPELPIMHFGKLADRDEMILANCRPEDVAHSMAYGQGDCTWRMLFILLQLHRCNQVYLSGPTIQGDVFRSNFLQAYTFFGKGMAEADTVKANYVEALGILLK